MKKFKATSILVYLVIVFLPSSFCMGQELNTDGYVLKDTCHSYRDGSFEGKSRSKYTGEPYWGIAKIIVKNDSITDINFMIRDSSLHETFNENYEKHFEGNPEYIEQSRNDWKGVQTYPKLLSETKDLERIDAISGATWSYNIFKASVKDALKNAKNKTDTFIIQEDVK